MKELELFKELIIPRGYEFYSVRNGRIIIMRVEEPEEEIKTIHGNIIGEALVWDQWGEEYHKNKVGEASLRRGDYIIYLGQIINTDDPNTRGTGDKYRDVKVGDIVKINRLDPYAHAITKMISKKTGKIVDRYLPDKFKYLILNEKTLEEYKQKGYKVVSLE
jgi:hypothetical protein